MFHFELSESFPLPLVEAQQLTYEQVKRLLIEVKGRLNIVITNWKTSGNVKMNLTQKENGIVIKIRGAHGDLKDEDVAEDNIKFVDNDFFPKGWHASWLFFVPFGAESID